MVGMTEANPKSVKVIETKRKPMKYPRIIKVVQIKKSPQMWSVKVGARYAMGFMGDQARDRAVAFAANLGEFTVVAKTTTKREQARLDVIAGLSKPT
jgi:hypothetical protein